MHDDDIDSETSYEEFQEILYKAEMNCLMQEITDDVENAFILHFTNDYSN